MEEHLEFQNELSKLLCSDSVTLRSIHIDESFSSDSEPDGRLLDEDYMRNQPPPCDYNIIKDHVVKIDTELIQTKKKRKKKKKKTNESSSTLEHAPTEFCLESDVSLLSQPKSDINPFNALAAISDHSPEDINSYPLDGYNTDTQTVANLSSGKDSSNFTFDFVSEVDSSWETAMNKKSKKSRKSQINENTEKSASLKLETITSNITSDSIEDNLALTHCDNVNNDTYFFLHPKSVPIHPNTINGITSSESHKENVECKKKTKKKKTRKKTSEFSDSTHLNNVTSAANAAYINNGLVSSPSTCYGTSTKDGILFQSNDKSGQCQPSEHKIALSANRINDYDSSSEMQEQRMTSGTKNNEIERKNALKQLPANDIHIEQALSQQQSIIECESIIWDWELHNNRKTHGATQNKIDLFGSDESIHTSTLSFAKGATHIEKFSHRKTEHFKGNMQYPIKGSSLFQYGARLQKKDELGNFIYITPNDGIDTCLLENDVPSYTLGTQMQPEKTQSSKKKRKKCKKSNQKQPNDTCCDATQLSIPAAKAEVEKPSRNNIATGSHIRKIDNVKSLIQTSKKVSGIETQPLQTKTSKQKRKKKCHKAIPISEHDIQDTYIFNESHFPPLFVNNINCSVGNITPRVPNVASMAWQISGGGTKSQTQSKLVNSATVPEPAPSNIFHHNKVSTKNKCIQKKLNIGGSDMTKSKIYEAEYPFTAHTNDSLTKDGMEKLENDIIRFFQSNIPCEFTANISPISQQGVFGRDNTKKHIASFVDKSGTSVSKPDPVSNSSSKIINNSYQTAVPGKKNGIIAIKSDCAQNVLLSAIANPGTNLVHISEEHGMKKKLSYISKILSSHIEIMICNQNISYLSIMIPGDLFQHIQEDQRCQSLILEFLKVGSGFQQQTSLFFYDEIYENSAINASIKESLYLEGTLQENLYNSLDGVAITATVTNNTQNLNNSSIRVECEQFLSSEINDGIMGNVMIEANTCLEVMTNTVQYPASSSNYFYLENDISHLPTDTVPASLEEHDMTDSSKLRELSNILAMNTEIIKSHENIHISVMIPAHLSEPVQKDQKLQNLILEFLTASALQNQTTLFFYDEIDEKGAIGDDSMTELFYHQGKLHKKTAYKDKDVNIPRPSNPVKVIDIYKTQVESPANSVSCSLDSFSMPKTGNIEKLNVSCTNAGFENLVSSEDNGETLIDENTCFDMMPRLDSTQSVDSTSSSCSLEEFDPICDIRNLYVGTSDSDNVQDRPYSSVVRTNSDYSSIVVENALRLSFYCLYNLIQDII